VAASNKVTYRSRCKILRSQTKQPRGLNQSNPSIQTFNSAFHPDWMAKIKYDHSGSVMMNSADNSSLKSV